jgi:RNA polymerase sigma factor (sigma-70 family)
MVTLTRPAFSACAAGASEALNLRFTASTMRDEVVKSDWRSWRRTPDLGAWEGAAHSWLVDLRGLNIASLEFTPGDQGKDLLHYLPDDGENLPSALLERSELERLLAAGIDEISPIERMVLALYYQEELTLREIAQVVRLHESRISQLKSQAILRLRSRLAKQWPATRGAVLA